MESAYRHMLNKFNMTILIWAFFLTACAGVQIFSDAEGELKKGMALFDRGDYAEAVPFFSRAVEMNPECAMAHFYLGRSNMQLGRWQDAVPALRTAWRLSPPEKRKKSLDFLIDALIGGAAADIKKGAYEPAVSYLKEGLNMRPDAITLKALLAEALTDYGSRLLGERNASGAVAVYQQALDLFPKNVRACIGMARALLMEGEYLEALRYAKEAETIDPANEAVQLLLIEMLRDRGRLP